MYEIMFGVFFIAISPFIYMIITNCSKGQGKEGDLPIITKFEPVLVCRPYDSAQIYSGLPAETAPR